MAFPNAVRRPVILWSDAELGSAADGESQLSKDGADLTVGNLLLITRSGQNMEGARFYWGAAGGSKTVKVSLWDAASARQRNASVAVSAAGFYSVSWDPIALTVFSAYRLSVWTTDGSGYFYMSTANYDALSGYAAPKGTPNGLTLGNNMAAGECYLRLNSCYSGGGDTVPSTDNTTLLTGAIDPVFSPVRWP